MVDADGHTDGQPVIGWPIANTGAAGSKRLCHPWGCLHGLGYARKHAHGVENNMMPDFGHHNLRPAR